MKLKPEFIALPTSLRLHQVKNPIMGLTGGVACGKSHFCSLLKKQNVLTLSADSLVKEAYKKKKVQKLLTELFPSVLNQDGGPNFKLLRQLFFQHKEKATILSEALYQELPSLFQERVQSLSPEQVIVYEIPLLFENNLHDKFDIIVCLWTSPQLQIQQLMKRDHLNEREAQKLISSQMDLQTKKSLSDYTIKNDGSNLSHEASLLIKTFFKH